MEYAVSVIKNVLGALYQTGGASLIIAALFMSVYMRIKKKGTGAVIQAWISEFRSSSQFRREFLLVFYVCMMLFRTCCADQSGEIPWTALWESGVFISRMGQFTQKILRI